MFNNGGNTRVLNVHYYPAPDGTQKKLVIYKDSSLALRTADSIAPKLDGLLKGMPMWKRVQALEELFNLNPKLLAAATTANQNLGNYAAGLAKVNRLKETADAADKVARKASREWLEASKKFDVATKPVDKFLALLYRTSERNV